MRTLALIKRLVPVGLVPVGLAVLALAQPASGQNPAAQKIPGAPAPDAARCFPRPLPDYAYERSVDLSAWIGCGAAQAWPWAAAYTPDGERLYASLFGGLIGAGGCLVARIDPATGDVLHAVTVGESPEEIAFVTHRDGSLRYGLVSDSSSSTVTVFDASDSVVATIPIPFDLAATWPTAFPFGMAVAPDRSTVYVGTGDGQGIVHAIDVETLTLDAARALRLGNGHGAGRMTFVGETLVVPATSYHPGFTGSTAKLVLIDPARPAAAKELILGSANDGTRFPTAQEVVADCDGRAYVVGFDLGPQVFVVDVASASALGTIPTGTSQPLGKFQALALSLDGWLVVGEFFTSELAWIDTWSGTWVKTQTPLDLPAFHASPGALVFSPSGDDLIVTYSASETLGVFRRQ